MRRNTPAQRRRRYASTTVISAWWINFRRAWLIPWQKKSQMRSHEQKREAVPKHSLPPQEQMLCYMGRFINCPYTPVPHGAVGFFITRGRPQLVSPTEQSLALQRAQPSSKASGTEAVNASVPRALRPAYNRTYVFAYKRNIL